MVRVIGLGTATPGEEIIWGPQVDRGRPDDFPSPAVRRQPDRGYSATRSEGSDVKGGGATATEVLV